MTNNYYVMLHDEKRCIGCQSCTVACKNVNQVADPFYRVQVQIKGPQSATDAHFQFFRVSCQHCEDAPCINVCPTGASYRDKDGIVQVNKNKCISCNYCIAACPYQVRYINPQTRAAEKCDFCSQSRLINGQEPACVTVCPTDALRFGRINDENIQRWIEEKQPYAHQLNGVGKPHLLRHKESHEKEPSNG